MPPTLDKDANIFSANDLMQKIGKPPMWDPSDDELAQQIKLNQWKAWSVKQRMYDELTGLVMRNIAAVRKAP